MTTPPPHEKAVPAMNKQSLRRADLVMSYVLLLLSVMVFLMSVISFLNPWSRDFEAINAEEFKMTFERWYEQPAILPLLCAVLLAVCALGLKKQAIREGAKLDFMNRASIRKVVTGREFMVTCIVVGLTALYLFVLIPAGRRFLDFFPGFRGFPFAVATFTYLLSFMSIFSEKKPRPLLVCLIVSGIGAIAITYGFGNLALIPLP